MDEAALAGRIADSDGSPEALAAIHHELVAQVGAHAASQMWWNAFAATDASET